MSRAVHAKLLSELQEAQLKCVNSHAEYASISSKIGRLARESGQLRLAEQAHRNAIQGFTLVRLETDGSKAPIDHMTLWEYEQLALTLYELPQSLRNAHKLHSLKREVKRLGPVAGENIVQGLTALSETERGLGELACSVVLRAMHRKQHNVIESVIGAALVGRGLGLRALSEDNLTPRSVGTWLHDLKPNIPDGIVNAPAFTTD